MHSCSVLPLETQSLSGVIHDHLHRTIGKKTLARGSGTCPTSFLFFEICVALFIFFFSTVFSTLDTTFMYFGWFQLHCVPHSERAFTYSKLPTETLAQGVKYVQS